MKIVNLASGIILPVIICFLLLLIKDFMGGFQFILIFALIVILFNTNKLKYLISVSLLLSILLSFLIFFLSILISSIPFYLITGAVDIVSREAYSNFPENKFFISLSVGVISPLLTVFGYTFLLDIKKDFLFNCIVILTICILFIIGMLGIYSNMINSLYLIWQPTVLLALQLLIYKREIKVLLK